MPPLALAVDDLRRCVQGYHRGTDRTRAELRRAARELSADARRRGASAPHVLIALKEAWPTLPEVQSLPRSEAAELLADLVKVCIEEYYRLPDEVVRQRT